MEMSSSDRGKEAQATPGLPGIAKAWHEDALGKLGMPDDEAIPLIIRSGYSQTNLSIKICFTSRLYPPHSSSLGKSPCLQFCSMGENMFVAEFESKRD